jgi:hypothetical protein
MKRVLLVVAAAVPLLAATPSATVPASAESASPVCAFDPAQEISAAPDPWFEDLFHRYGDSNKHLDDWTGGDTTNSVPLSDDRIAWIFSDTFLGRVNQDHSRSDPRFINNSLVVQADDRLVDTRHGGTPSRPQALVSTDDGRQMQGTPTVGSTWYWMGDGTVEGNKLHVFVLKFEKFGPDMFDFRWLSNGVATFSLRKLRLERVTPITSSNNVQYGSGILEDDEYVYIYGTEDEGLDKWMHVARARRGDLLGQWEFFTGLGWSTDPSLSARLLHGVGNEYSVTKIGNAYLLVTMDTNVPFSREIYAYVSCAPTGPWSEPKHLYTAPDYPFSNAFTYNAHAHPEFTGNNELLVTYNVNSFDFQDILDDVHIYRPRFIRVQIPTIIEAP